MRRPVATILLASVASLTVCTGAWPADSFKDRLKNAIPMRGFSVDGKRGKFLKQIKDRDFAPPPAAAGALGFGALEKGDLQKARLNMPLTEARVQEMLTKLDKGWEYPRYGTLKVYVIGSGRYQALARPDASMTVTIGMIDQAKSDDEVAFMFAHELSHIRMNHFARDQQMAKMRQVATQLNAIYSDAVKVSQLRMKAVGEDTKVYTEDEKKVRAAGVKAAATKQQMDMLLTVLVDTPWSRRDEDEADAGGFDLAEIGQYAGDVGSANAFRNMQVDYDLGASLGAALQSQMTESLGVLTQQAGSILQTGSGTLSLDEQIKQAKANMLANARAAAFKYFTQRHRAPEDRQKGLLTYSKAAGYQAKMADPPTAWLDATRATKEFRDARTVVRGVQDSIDARAKGDFPGAVAAIAPAMKTSFGNTPFVANESAQAYDAAGDSVRAEQQFMLAHKHPDQTIDGYQAHLSMLLRLRRYPHASEIAKAGATRYGDERPFLPSLLAASFRTGKKEEAAVYLAKCMATENAALKDLCIQALTDPSFQKQYDALPPHSRALVDAELTKASAQASVAPSAGVLGTLGSMLKAAEGSN